VAFIYSSDMESVVGFVLLEDLSVAKSLGQGQRQLTEFRRDMIRFVAQHSLRVFAWYRIALGLLIGVGIVTLAG